MTCYCGCSFDMELGKQKKKKNVLREVTEYRNQVPDKTVT